MEEYKVRQIIYNRLHPHDDLVDENVLFLPDKASIIEYGILYFREDLPELVYPAKSFSVAIIYAYLLQKHFNADFYRSVDDPTLLCGNDKYFSPYSQEQEIYGSILDGIGFFGSDFHLNENLAQISKTVSSFREEFGLV